MAYAVAWSHWRLSPSAAGEKPETTEPRAHASHSRRLMLSMDFSPVVFSVVIVLKHSLCHKDPLVRLHSLAFKPALAVRQDHFDVTFFDLAEAEVRDGLLAGGVTVADADF